MTGAGHMTDLRSAARLQIPLNWISGTVQKVCPEQRACQRLRPHRLTSGPGSVHTQHSGSGVNLVPALGGRVRFNPHLWQMFDF